MRSVLNLLNTSGTRHEAHSYCDIGSVYIERGDYEQAKELLKKAVSIAKEQRHPIIEYRAVQIFATFIVDKVTLNEPRSLERKFLPLRGKEGRK